MDLRRNKMINVISGKFFYKYVCEKSDTFKQDFIDFLGSNGFKESELKKVINLDLNSDIVLQEKINHSICDISIKINKKDITLLFGTKLDSIEFTSFTETHFK